MDSTAEDIQILDQLAGDGWAQVGADHEGQLFQEVGRRGRRQRRARRMRKARRKGFDSLRAMRKGRRKKIARGVKKVANNKIVRAVSKAVLSVVPGGQAIVGITTAARMGAKAVKKIKSAAKRGDRKAAAALALGEAAKRGDVRALDTLKEAASGRQATLPVPPKLQGLASMFGSLGADGADYVVRGPSGRSYTFAADQL